MQTFSNLSTECNKELVEFLRRPEEDIDDIIITKEIISKQIFNQKTNKVDANALLLDVEAEVAPASFRNKIFDALTDGFERARDAVANRNN